MSTPSPVETPRTLAARLNAARAAYTEAVRLAGAGDLKARSRLSALRREQEELEREYAVECDVATERGRLDRDARTAAERRRRREGLDAVDATFAEQAALAKHADALLDELGGTLTRLNALGANVVEQFRAHCPTPRLGQAFCEIGFHGNGLIDETLKKLWQIHPIAEVLRRHGAGALTIHRPPSLEEAVRAMQRRALNIVDQARTAVGEPTDLPPAA